MECYKRVQVILGAIQAKYAPNVMAVARRLAAGAISVEQTWTNYAFQSVEPGLDYFKLQLSTSLKEALAAFKAARLFSPSKLTTMSPAVDSISVFPFLNSSNTQKS